MSIISKDSVVLRHSRVMKRLNLDKVKAQAIRRNKDTIVQLNRDQMRGSQKADGLLPEYSQSTLFLKDFSNYRGIYPRFDLYDTGSFQDKMFLKVDNNSVFINSLDSKADDIVARLGREIFELNPHNQKQAMTVVTLDFNAEIHRRLNK